MSTVKTPTSGTRQSLPRPLSKKAVAQLLMNYEETPRSFWLTVRNTWDLTKLAERGNLGSNVERIYNHYASQPKNDRYCLILLDRGPL
jgi:hypothetical protein